MGSRRMTMGPSLDDSRLSMGWGAPSGRERERASFGAPLTFTRGKLAPPTTGKKENSHMSRLSTVGGAGDARRSSLFGKLTLGRTDSKADPRPLNNKAFQNDAITAIVEFCQATNYRAGPISAKILSNPTGKDFANIMVHLCQQLDATYTLGGKVEDEVTTLLKSLRYPFVPSKTSLTAVGSPSTYPAVLAAMSWVVDLLMYDATSRQMDDEAIEASLAKGPQTALSGTTAVEASSSAEGAFFFTYVSEAYEAFLCGDDAKVAILDNALSQAFEARYSDVERDIDDLESENDSLKAELASLRSVQSTLPKLRANVAELGATNDKLRKAQGDMEATRDTLAARLEKEAAALREREKEHARVTSALTEVSHKLQTQELSAGDVERMAVKKQRLRDQYSALRDEAHAIEKEAGQENQALKRAVSTLQTRIGEYIALSHKLQLLPLGAKYSFGVDFTLRFNESYLDSVSSSDSSWMMDASSASLTNATGDFSAAAATGAASASTTCALLGTDLKHTIKPQLRELRAKMQKQAGEHGRTVLELTEALATYEEAQVDASNKMELLHKRLKTTEEQVSSLRGDADATLASADSETSDLSVAVSQARTDLAVAQAAVRELSPEVLHGMRLAIDTQVKAMDAARKRVNDRIATSLLSVTNHKELITSKLMGLRSRFQAYRNDYLSKPAPSMPPVPTPTLVSSATIAASAALNSVAPFSRHPAPTATSYPHEYPHAPAADSMHESGYRGGTHAHGTGHSLIPTPGRSSSGSTYAQAGTAGRASLAATYGSASASRPMAPGSAMSIASPPSFLMENSISNTSRAMSLGSAYGGNIYDDTAANSGEVFVPRSTAKVAPTAALSASAKATKIAQRLAFEHSTGF